MGLLGSPAKVYKPADKVNLGSDSDEEYIHANVKAPRMTGFVVRLFAWVLELRIIGQFLAYILKRNNLVHQLVSFAVIPEPPLFTPTHAFEGLVEQEVVLIQPGIYPTEKVQRATSCVPKMKENHLQDLNSSFQRWTVMDFYRAYCSHKATPLLVAKRFISFVEESSKPELNMSFFISYDSHNILKQAEESTKRYENGNPISVLDGILVAVKDEIDCMPYPTTGGTKWLHKMRPCVTDAVCVEQLRSCGAILVGKTNMHELGAGTSGINPHYGATRNPYDINKITGGSSSGSAAVVAAGLCPIALGVDGGGSVRIPASLCGVVGFKPTFGRISHSGVIPLNYTVGMPGILAGTIEDALIAYSAICEHPVKAEVMFPQLASTKSISNIKIAKYGKWFDDSTEEVRNCCGKAIRNLCNNYGWKIVDVTIPEIEEMRLAHYATIASECADELAPFLEKLSSGELGGDARVAMQIYGSFHSREYLNAQRLRNRQMHFHKEIFKVADVIATPTTGITAYPLQRDAFKSGELDYINGAALVRYSIAGNFLGLPAISVPVGYDRGGMPISLQLIGSPWAEATLLHLGYALQVLSQESSRRPRVFYDLLKN